MRLRAFIAIVGAVLILAGLSLGLLIPVSVAGSDRTVKCGSAWSQDYADAVAASNDALVTTGTLHDYRVDCRSSRGTQGMIAIVLGVAGVLTVLGAATIRKPAAVAT